MSYVKILSILMLSLVVGASMGSAFAKTLVDSVNLSLKTFIVNPDEKDMRQCFLEDPNTALYLTYYYGQLIDLQTDTDSIMGHDWMGSETFGGNSFTGAVFSLDCPSELPLLTSTGKVGNDPDPSVENPMVTITAKLGPNTSVLPNSEGLLVRDNDSTAQGVGVAFTDTSKGSSLVGNAIITKGRIWHFGNDGKDVAVVYQGHVSDLGRDWSGGAYGYKSREFDLGAIVACGAEKDCQDDGHITGGFLRASVTVSVLFD